MTSKISVNPNKVSTIMLSNIEGPKTDGRKREFSSSFMKDYITKSIRETRYFETIQSMTTGGKKSPQCLANQSYAELFKNLVESCRSFFTKEYGKNEEDYNKFVENCTKIYETPERNENIISLERIKLFKIEHIAKKKSRVSVISLKKSKASIFSRRKSKGDLKARPKMSSAMKRTRSISKRTKKTKRGVDGFIPMIERSCSDFNDSSSDDQHKDTLNKDAKKSKPFVYKLSDPEMIRRGITVNYQPPVRLVTFLAYPSGCHRFWFQRRREVLERYYPNKIISWKHDREGSAAVYYDNGEPAISFVFGRIGPLIIVYSKSQMIRDKPIKPFPVALFDTRGNGIVYNKNTGKKRLLYDQAEGIWLDSPSKCPIPWKWKSYNQVVCRRGELKFVSPTYMDDFNCERGKSHNLKRIESLHRKLKSKILPSIYEFKKSKSIKKPRKTENSQMLKFSKIKKKKTSKMGSFKSEHSETGVPRNRSKTRNSILRNIDIPKLIRFVGRGFIIKPVLTPCTEMEPVKINVATLCQPTLIIPRDSVVFSKRTSSLENSSSLRRGHVGIKARSLNMHQDDKIFREPRTRCKHKQRLCLLKPIVLNLTDKISLTITDQEHIHIDFISPPVHYSFNIGVKIAVEKVDSIFDIRIPTLNKEPITSILEAFKLKCPILCSISKTVKNLRSKELQKSRRNCVKKLKAWGQDKYLGKVPLCKLMDNKCSCRDCNCFPLNLEK